MLRYLLPTTAALLAFLTVLLACTTATPAPSPTETPAPEGAAATPASPPDTLEPEATATPVPTGTPASPETSTPDPTSTSTRAPAGEMTSADIYQALHPSVAHIQTPTGSGSGFLIEGSYVVTNHHVVWPFQEVLVVFPDGTDTAVPVIAWDPVSDTAVLGPVDVEAPPLELRDGEDLAVGSELFLLGYPGESEPFPEPTIVSGVLSQYRQWDQPGITYFQTDAVIAGGQSGGVLVNLKGEVIGVSGFTITEADYALVASAADLAPIIQQLIQGQDPWGVGNRSLSGDEADLEFSASLRNHWDSAMYLLDVDTAEVVEFEIDSPAPASFRVADHQGNILLDGDNGFGGTRKGSVEVTPDQSHFLVVETTLQSSAGSDIGSSVALRPFTDPDDGGRLGLGETIAGSIDYPGDRDWFSLYLNQGDSVRISADSLNVDTTLHIDFIGSHVDQVAYDDDSGGGIYGTNSELVYRASRTGEHLVAAGDLNGDMTGGYFLSAVRTPAGADAFVVPPSPQQVDSHFGRMIVLESSLAGFSVQVPASWIQTRPKGEGSNLLFQAVSPERDASVSLREFDLAASNASQPLGEFVDRIREDLSERGAPLQYEQQVVSSSAYSHAILKFQDEDEPGTWALLAMKEERYLLFLQYGFREHEPSKALADYSFGTLRSSGIPVLSGMVKSSNLGQYFKGRTLHVSVVSLQRLPELRYSTIDPEGVIRHWAILPSDTDSELILARLKVENHTVDRITVNVHRSVAELRDQGGRSHHPVAIAQNAWQDFHGEPEALIRVDQGDCFDGGRALIEPGTTVRWQSLADTAQYIAFEDTRVAIGTKGRAELPPGESVSHVFDEAGTYRYACENRYGRELPAVVRVMPADERAGVARRSVSFLEGDFELLKGYGLDGYLVFEVPAGSEFQALRWRAGDSIHIPL